MKADFEVVTNKVTERISKNGSEDIEAKLRGLDDIYKRARNAILRGKSKVELVLQTQGEGIFTVHTTSYEPQVRVAKTQEVHFYDNVSSVSDDMQITPSFLYCGNKKLIVSIPRSEDKEYDL